MTDIPTKLDPELALIAKPQPFFLSIEPVNRGTYTYGYHLGTDERIAREFAVEIFRRHDPEHGQGLYTVALMRMVDGKRTIVDVYDGRDWFNDMQDRLYRETIDDAEVAHEGKFPPINNPVYQSFIARHEAMHEAMQQSATRASVELDEYSWVSPAAKRAVAELIANPSWHQMCDEKVVNVSDKGKVWIVDNAGDVVVTMSDDDSDIASLRMTTREAMSVYQRLGRVLNLLIDAQIERMLP